jgi:parvulin-like peptidyl-prolyl isomerase
LKKITLAFMAALLIAAFVSCTVKEPVGKAAATVNGISIPDAAVKWSMQGNLAQHAAAKVDEAAMRSAILNQLIDDRLLAEGAKEKGLSVLDSDLKVHMDAESSMVGAEKFSKSLKDAGLTEKQYQDLIRDKILATMFTRTLFNDTSLTDAMLKDMYMKVRPMMPETVTIRFIEFKDEAAAAKAASRIKSGDFDKVADAYKGDKTATVSGYGEVSTSFFDAAASKAVGSLKPGAWIGPVKGSGGFYLIRLKQHNQPRPKTFDEARDELRHSLSTQMRNHAISAWIAGRRANAKIVISN